MNTIDQLIEYEQKFQDNLEPLTVEAQTEQSIGYCMESELFELLETCKQKIDLPVIERLQNSAIVFCRMFGCRFIAIDEFMKQSITSTSYSSFDDAMDEASQDYDWKYMALKKHQKRLEEIAKGDHNLYDKHLGDYLS